MDDPFAPYRSGSAEPWTVDLLCALIVARQPHIVVETGRFLGLTTRALFAAMRTYLPVHGGMLHSVEYDKDRYDAVVAGRHEWCVAQTDGLGCALYHREAVEYLRGCPDDSVDFVFLDDDHDANHVNAELYEVRRILRPGGLCAVHDVIGPFGLDRVVRLHSGIIIDLPRLHAAGGLGLISK